VPVGLGCTGGRVLLDLYRAAGRISGVTSAQVCVLFSEIILVSMGIRLSTTRGTLSVGSTCRAACVFVYMKP